MSDECAPDRSSISSFDLDLPVTCDTPCSESCVHGKNNCLIFMELGNIYTVMSAQTNPILLTIQLCTDFCKRRAPVVFSLGFSSSSVYRGVSTFLVISPLSRIEKMPEMAITTRSGTNR
uniref:Uncharacterized protein n=1 Tax=Cacopsylla melanoneura TaxID=428564 RepID=A0A8D8R0C5_9HEMI